MSNQSLYETAVQEYMANELAQYNARVDAARASERERLKAEQAARAAAREQLAIQVEKMCDADGRPYSAQAKAQWLDAHAPLLADAEIDRQVEQAAAMIERPMSEACVAAMFAHLRQPETLETQTASQPLEADAVYRLADSRLYDVPARAWLETCEDATRVIDLGGDPTDANLKETLLFYQKTQPQIKLPAFLLTEDELFANLRLERDSRLAATDYLLTPDYPIAEAALAEIKAYRTALRDLPAMPGAPWDGGGAETPWPALPQMVKA